MTSGISSPEIFRRWAAISTIAMALQRNVWVVTDGSMLYPHLYVVLVAPPGIGKTKIIVKGRRLLEPLAPEVHLAHSSLTAASLIDNLAEATRRVTRLDAVPAVTSYNSLAIMSTELGVLLPAYDTTFMNTLQDLYDGFPYSQKRRTRDITIEIKAPQLNILAGCTPAYLQNTLPEGAWAEGFTARCLFIFSGDQVIASLFQEAKDNTEQEKDLAERLKTINELYGKITFTPEAARFIDAWHLGGRHPVPDHPRLFYYNTRRTVNVIKLSMIACVSEGAQMVIQKHHIQRALDWLIEAEHFIPEIFKSMDNTSHSQILRETWHYVFDTWRKENQRPVSAARVINYVSKRVPAQFVERVLQVLENNGMLRRVIEPGGVCYVPSKKD